VAHHDVKPANVLMCMPIEELLAAAHTAAAQVQPAAGAEDLFGASHTRLQCYLHPPILKLCDFGLAVVGDDCANCMSGGGTLEYN
jgi:serine/threonine protein kinase